MVSAWDLNPSILLWEDAGGGQFMKLLRPIFVLFCFLSKFLAILFLNLLSVLKESRTSRFSSVRNVAVSQAEER